MCHLTMITSFVLSQNKVKGFIRYCVLIYMSSFHLPGNAKYIAFELFCVHCTLFINLDGPSLNARLGTHNPFFDSHAINYWSLLYELHLCIQLQLYVPLYFTMLPNRATSLAYWTKDSYTSIKLKCRLAFSFPSRIFCHQVLMSN